MNKIINSKLIYEGKIITVKKLDVLLPNNINVEREFVHHKAAVAMIPIIDNNVILVNQYRIGSNSILSEIPAGLLEENENPEQCALRELQEEIGYTSNKLTFLGAYYLSPGYSDEIIYLYLCEDLTPSSLQPDDDEFITISYISINNLKELLISDATTKNKKLDAKTYLALSLYLNIKKGSD